MAKKFIFVNVDGDYEESPGAYEQSDFINTSAGVADAGKPIVLDAAGQIDPSMINFGAIDHGALTGLADDDHVQYILVDGTRAFTGDQSVGNFKLTNLADGTADQDAVNVRQLQNAINGIDWKESARVATTANINLASAPAAIDGVTLVSGDRVVVKDQTDPIENGIYVFNGTGSAMTRSLDADQDSEVTAMMTVAVSEGTVHADQVFTVTSNDNIIVGTSAIVFGILPVNTFVGGDGIDVTGQTISADLLASGGLKFVSGELAVEPNDFAGNGLIDDGSDNLAIDFASVFTIDSADAKAIEASKLASTANGEGASIIGVEDSAGLYTANNVEGILAEIATKLVDRDCATAGAAINAGDLLYFTANDTVSPMPIGSANRAVGIALESAASSAEVCYARWDEVALGVLTGATAGDRYYWDGSALTTTIPSGSGQYVWQVGIAKNATDLLATVEFVKKNS